MQRDQRHDKIFVQLEPVWFLIDGIFDLGTKASQRVNTRQKPDQLSEVVDDAEIELFADSCTKTFSNLYRSSPVGADDRNWCASNKR